ncbi:unnamed protein product [Lota lota]
MAAQHVGAGHVLPPTNGRPPSNAEHDDMENTMELRLMMAYAQRRRPQDKRPIAHDKETSDFRPSAVPPSVEEAEPKKKKKKKSFKKRLHQIFSCVGAPKGAKADEGGQDVATFRNGGFPHDQISGGEDKEEEETQESERVDELATSLIELADISFIPPEIEADSVDDDIQKLAGLLLRQCGDTIFEDLLSSYGMFGTLMSTVFHKIGLSTPDPGDQGPKDSNEIKTNIAVTCEVASRLSAMDTHPMSRVLGFGARYLKEHYSLEAALNVAEDPDSDKDVE